MCVYGVHDMAMALLLLIAMALLAVMVLRNLLFRPLMAGTGALAYMLDRTVLVVVRSLTGPENSRYVGRCFTPAV